LANIKSQIKRNRQNEQARLRNKSVRAASKGVIHKNNAANHKARLARSVNQQGQ
jgi:small subunit ribosomal protein S20